MPNQYEAIVFYIEALDKADMYEEAIDYLTVMKSKARKSRRLAVGTHVGLRLLWGEAL